MEDRSFSYKSGRTTVYKVDCKFRKIDKTQHIRWCRKNLGTLGTQWDFISSARGDMLEIIINDPKAVVIYELWMN